MRIGYPITLIATLLLSGTYWYQSTAAICPAPISYRLGELSSSFGLTPAQAKEHIAAAELVWEEAAGQDLFVYDDDAKFTVDFVYDERQETADQEQSERKLLDAQRDKNDEIMAVVAELRADYERLSASYETRTRAYEQQLTEHNQTVQRYNDRGGAPSDVYAELEQEGDRLSQEAAELNRMADQLQSLATELNEVSERGNRLVTAYNYDVERYNEQYGFSREFTQGDYQGDAIHIYTFSNAAELESVLVHEFGHALGIDHVDDKTAVMYYLMEEPIDEPQLTEADLAAYTTACGDLTSTGHRARRLIREFITNF